MATTIPIEAQRYNDLRNLVNKVLGVSVTATPNYGYGQGFNTSAVTGDYDTNTVLTDKVTAEQYENLYIDLIRIRVHQIGQAATTVDSFVEGDFENNPSSADKIELAYIQALESLATNIETDRFLVEPTTQAEELDLEDALNNPISSTRLESVSGTFRTTIDHIVKVSFTSAEDRRHFFNSGGEIRFNASVDYAGSQAKTVDWQNQLISMGTISFKALETVSSEGVGSSYAIGNFALNSSYQLCYDQSGGATYARNHYYIRALELNDREIQFKIEFVDGRPNDLSWGIDEPVFGDFTSSLKLLRAVGEVTVNDVDTDSVVYPASALPIGLTVKELS